MPKKMRVYDTIVNCKVAHKDIELIDRVCRALRVSRSEFIRGALKAHVRTFFGDVTEQCMPIFEC